MDNLSVIILVIAIMVIIAGLWSIWISQSGTKVKAEISINSPRSIIRMRNAPGSGVDMVITQSGNSPDVIPFHSETDSRDIQEKTIVEEFNDPATPYQRKEELARDLIDLGYIVNLPPEPPSAEDGKKGGLFSDDYEIH